ncbi:hypothetical protein [Methanoplanus endosymbiosus]|uniref:Uncharacterized protein n=1 Tax=Methanoplanus endosymbiosus TaxID=33865 RepID=A0A9E7PLJ4_9EURY|nr:hypothetical protein [Methanoplanus endosymbiosus]UUX91194.1 hypothetical protein L6E24_07320 [Methanoplanus endosymbiosus]
MKYSTRDLIIFAGSTIAVLANIANIALGATGNGLYISLFVILMFIIVIMLTLKKCRK